MHKLLLQLHTSNLGRFIKRKIRPSFPGVYVYFLAKSIYFGNWHHFNNLGVVVTSHQGKIVIRNNHQSCVQKIILSQRHVPYVHDVANSFQYYFSAVTPIRIRGVELVDYSLPGKHQITGFNLFPIHLPSLAEPISTNLQYIDFGRLVGGDVVIDLGAYSGLSSIMFKEAVGQYGQVIAVEADESNLESLEINLCEYLRATNNSIELLRVAVWNHSDGIYFSSDGNMGSSASNYLSSSRGSSKFVQSMTLSDIAERFNLKKIALIKCDIEGGETVIFDDEKFFFNFKPRIIVEPHLVGGELSTKKVADRLEAYGYSVTEVLQPGVQYPLLECVHNST